MQCIYQTAYDHPAQDLLAEEDSGGMGQPDSVQPSHTIAITLPDLDIMTFASDFHKSYDQIGTMTENDDTALHDLAWNDDMFRLPQSYELA